MNPTEKAQKLVKEFERLRINFPYIDTVDGQSIGSGYITYNSAIDCALIAVKEVNYGGYSLFWSKVENELIKMKL